MNSFVTYPIDRLPERRTRDRMGGITWLLGLEDVPDEHLFDAIRDSGVILTGSGQTPVPVGNVLSMVLRERASRQRRQAQ